ncbi:MAG: peptidase [Acidobacteria bacterium]|nr:MAG: peptidase [Acidobacteriota bacterium]REK06181.1 MAG: peptidase [Acidobacteriota bacterium]
MPDLRDQVQACTIKPVPDELFIQAARAAIEENPRNAPMRTLGPAVAPGMIGPAEMAILTGKRWVPGRVLRVKFQGGDATVRDRIVPFARRWEEHANLTLDFVGENDDAEIRIAFGNSGSWSYLGTDALVFPDAEPTMNYGWLRPNSSDDEYRRVVLHEFGHALAAVHEHAHPQAGIPWDLPKVYEYYRLTQGWTPSEVDQQVLRRYSADQTNASEYDPDSIMHYPVSNALTIGDFAVDWNRDLSQRDREFIAVVYPGAGPQQQELAPGTPVSAEIGEHGEEDEFRFSLQETSQILLETSGGTDVVMSVFGPDDETRLAAFDDDSGTGLNARIGRLLPAGGYLVRIRHWHPRGTGEYDLRLSVDPV